MLPFLLPLILISTCTNLSLQRSYVSIDEPLTTLFIYTLIMSHLCISSMSLSFHRFHTHKGVILSKYIDRPMQILLWLITGLNKSEWVSVHLYHHAHSDQAKDPHSPVQKGILHALFLGVFDYTKAKKTAPVQAIAKRLKMDAFEKFLLRNSNLGLVIMTSINLVVFGFKFGLIISCCNFLISPIFAVGGVNALAHWAGYRNHKSSDNSRNLGFLLPLNFIICGELDHNNHHAQQKSCSFRHQWYEFDIGYVYIKIFSFLGLAKIKNVYTLQNMNQDMISQAKYIIENNLSIQQQFDSISRESDIHVNELKEKVYAYLEDRGVSIERSLHELSLNIIKLIHHTRYQATC